MANFDSPSSINDIEEDKHSLGPQPQPLELYEQNSMTLNFFPNKDS